MTTQEGQSGKHRRAPMSPEAIRRFPLARTTFGRRGYAEDHVELFLERLANEVEAWIAENSELRAEVHHLRDWALGRTGQGAPPTNGTHVPDVAAVNLLSRAQQEADSLVAQAQDYARRVADLARRQYEEELRVAQVRAQEEAERAAMEYRARAGAQYTAEFEEFERRVAWVKAFLSGIQGIETQLRAAREALTYEVNKLTVAPAPGGLGRSAADRYPSGAYSVDGGYSSR